VLSLEYKEVHFMPKKFEIRYPEHKLILDNYLNLNEFINLSPLTLKKKKVAIISLLNFLGDQDKISLNQLKPCDITNYLNSISELASSTISGRRFVYRHFLNHLYTKGIIIFSGDEQFPVIISNKRDRLPSFYSQKEICNLISNVNPKTSYGKRDLCVILMITELGIRSGDIIRLQRSNIHWERNTLEFTQHKTKVFIQLPLLENLKYALLDYLKNARPNSEYNNIFIGIKNGLKPISNSQVHEIVSHYFKKANIDITTRHHGPHAMRYSLASSLLQHNTPIYVIKDILGHTNLNTTKTYLNIDLDTLRKYALEVPDETV